MKLRTLLEAGGESAGKKEIAKTTLEEAVAYFKKKLDKMEYSLDVELPHFEENYTLLRKLVLNHGSEKRIDMPVISWKQVKQFQQSLIDGHIDIKKPYNKELKKLLGKFPKKLKSDEGKLWLKAGLDDGSTDDDKINATFENIAVKNLKPVQEQIYLSKVIDNYEKYGIPHDTHKLTIKTLIITKDNEIIDGHHRWTTMMITDPELKAHVLKVDLDLETLLQVSKTYGVSMGNKQNS